MLIFILTKNIATAR